MHKPQVQLAGILLLVFGKRFGWTENVVLEHAFDNAFSVEKSKAVWSKIGINSYIRKYLQDSNIAHELIVLPDRLILDLDADPATLTLIAEDKKKYQSCQCSE